MLLCAFAFGALAMLGERGMVHPSAVWLAPMPDGNFAIALRQQEFLSSSTSFKVGRTEAQDRPRWITSWTGELDGIETFPDGSVVAYSGGQALRWPASAISGSGAEDGVSGSEPERLVSPPMTGSVRVPGLAGDRVLYAWLTGDGLRVAPTRGVKESGEVPIRMSATEPLAEGQPSASPANAPESAPVAPLVDPGGHWIPLPGKIDLNPAAVSMASYQASGFRHHVVVIEGGGKGRTIRDGKLKVVSFDLVESWEPADAAMGGTPGTGLPTQSAPPGESSAASPGHPEATATPADQPATEPAPSPAPANPPVRLVRTVRPGNVVVHELASTANRFWSAATATGVTVAWREPKGSDSVWRAATGSNDYFTPMTTLAPLDAPFAERPNFIPVPDGIGLLVPTPVVDRLDRHVTTLTGDNAGTWNSLDPISLGRSNLPLPVETLLMLMIFAASAGLMGMAWLNVNRTRDAEEALAEVVRQSVGRDTTPVKETGKPSAERIQWATMTRRGFAFLIDFIAISPLVIIICETAGIDANAALNIYPLRQTYLLEGLGPRLVTLGVFGAYAFSCEAYFGRSLGKMVLGLRVVTRRGARAGIFALFVRNVVRIVELCATLMMVVALGSMVFSKRNQRLGDVLAGTGVRHEIEEESGDDNMPTEWDR
jgi:uncharacterized RDD family membrane protein YckC